MLHVLRRQLTVTRTCAQADKEQGRVRGIDGLSWAAVPAQDRQRAAGQHGLWFARLIPWVLKPYLNEAGDEARLEELLKPYLKTAQTHCGVSYVPSP